MGYVTKILILTVSLTTLLFLCSELYLRGEGRSPSSLEGILATLPNGWVEALDSGNKTYYYNQKLGLSSWDPPKDYYAKSSSAVKNSDTMKNSAVSKKEDLEHSSGNLPSGRAYDHELAGTEAANSNSDVDFGTVTPPRVVTNVASAPFPVSPPDNSQKDESRDDVQAKQRLLSVKPKESHQSVVQALPRMVDSFSDKMSDEVSDHELNGDVSSRLGDKKPAYGTEGADGIPGNFMSSVQDPQAGQAESAQGSSSGTPSLETDGGWDSVQAGRADDSRSAMSERPLLSRPVSSLADRPKTEDGADISHPPDWPTDLPGASGSGPSWIVGMHREPLWSDSAQGCSPFEYCDKGLADRGHKFQRTANPYQDKRRTFDPYAQATEEGRKAYPWDPTKDPQASTFPAPPPPPLAHIASLPTRPLSLSPSALPSSSLPPPPPHPLPLFGMPAKPAAAFEAGNAHCSYTLHGADPRGSWPRRGPRVTRG